MKDCGKKEEMKKVIMEAQGESGRNATSRKSRKIEAIPPFITRAIILAKDDDRLEVILTILRAVSEQDDE